LSPVNGFSLLGLVLVKKPSQVELKPTPTLEKTVQPFRCPPVSWVEPIPMMVLIEKFDDPIIVHYSIRSRVLEVIVPYLSVIS
jgi:hypothetical protein